MDGVKINKKGQITIPKEIRDQLGWTSDISLIVEKSEWNVIVRPASICLRCKKALPDAAKGVCPNCPPPITIEVY